MIDSASAVLEELRRQGFRPRLHREKPDAPDDHPHMPARLVIDGDEAPLSARLREAVQTHRDEIKAALLLAEPPAWLRRLFDLYWSGHQTPVRLSNPASGKAETYMVRVSIKNIAALLAADIGMDPLEWEAIRHEVEEALGSPLPA